MGLFIIHIIVSLLLTWSVFHIVRENSRLRKQLVETNVELLSLQRAVTRVFQIKFKAPSIPLSQDILEEVLKKWAENNTEATPGK